MSMRIVTAADLGIDSAAGALADLWNVSAPGAYGFFPLTADRIAARILREKRFHPKRLLFAREGAAAVGFLHWDVVNEPYYAPAAAVEAFGVRPEARRRGIGTALLTRALHEIDREPVRFVDAGGTFPYTPFYSTLIDGSERSGPFLEDVAVLRLLEGKGFHRERESLVMTRDLRTDLPAPPDPEADGAVLTTTPRAGKLTWLDYVFRGWDLLDRILLRPDGQLLSRAITARMDGFSDHTERERFALFGVNTPEPLRGKGQATRMLRQCLAHLAAEGAEEVELHVYADNTPALRLYRRIGFRERTRTVVMRRPCS